MPSASGGKKATLLVLPGENVPFDLVVDETRGGFFWSEPYSGKVMYAALNGTGVSEVAGNLSFPSGEETYNITHLFTSFELLRGCPDLCKAGTT